MRDSDWLKINLRLIFLICVQTQILCNFMQILCKFYAIVHQGLAFDFSDLQ